MISEERIRETLKRVWGYDTFREGQHEVIESVCEGNDTLVLMPTGAGKSLLYQLPTMAGDGLCVVVTPLISLMKDQVDALRRRNVQAVAIHSGLTPRSIDIALDNCVYGDIKFLYIAPERIGSDMFLLRAQRMNIALIAVDEAHCISQWGYDFRPSYLRIDRLRKLTPLTPVLALTASATDRVCDDIMERLHFARPNIIRSNFARPNLSLAVRKSDDKQGQLMRIVENVEGSGIVYLRTRQATEQICNFLRDNGVAANYYHAGLPSGERALRQEEWSSGKVRIVCATNAFGMGIDKADVRFVVHYDVCDSLEAYYQEAGRAGRDRKRSYAVLLAGSDEKSKLQKRFALDYPSIETIKKCYSLMCNYLQVGYGDGKEASFIFDMADFCKRMKMFAPVVVNSLKILQQNGYITFTDVAEHSARLMFCVSRDDLYSYRVERENSDTVLRTILRLYEGVFSEFRPIDTQEIALYSGVKELSVKEQLKQFWRHHIIRYIPKNTSPMIFFNEERLKEEDLYINPETYHFRREQSAARIEKMFEYVDNQQQCRSVMLQEYFGQKDAKDCGCCDVCLRKRREAKAELNAMNDKPKTETEEESIRSKIMEMAATGEMSVKQIVGQFATEPEQIIEELNQLMEQGRLCVKSNGIVETTKK